MKKRKFVNIYQIQNQRVKKLLNETEIDSLDDRANLSLYKTNLETASVVKKRIKKISKIVKELKKIK